LNPLLHYSDKSDIQGILNGPCCIADIQLFDDPLSVGVNRIDRDEKLVSNLLADQSFGKKLEYFLFPQA
jgi:hypothetical protein